MRILVVEDQAKMASFIKKGLVSQGYVVDVAGTGEIALELAYENPYDLLILDVNLPDMLGFEVARLLRADEHQEPILMLTAQSTTKDKIQGLDAGADDYLTKPFEFDELLARVRALFRRRQQHQVEGSLQKLVVADLEMDLIGRKVKRGGQSIPLTAKEFSLLEYFMRHPERPLSRTQISEHVWEVSFDTSTNIVDVYVNMLRKKIDGPFAKKLIHTKIGFGYILSSDDKV